LTTRGTDSDVAEPWHQGGEIIAPVEAAFEFEEVEPGDFELLFARAFPRDAGAAAMRAALWEIIGVRDAVRLGRRGGHTVNGCRERGIGNGVGKMEAKVTNFGRQGDGFTQRVADTGLRVAI
jgi:hypothetical protein